MKSFFLLFLLLTTLSSYAQTIDETFKEPLLEAPSRIKCIKVLSEGKLLVGGDIAYFKSIPVNNLIRLNTDSTLDESFYFTGHKDLLINKIELQSNGDIVVLARGYESLRDVVWGNYSLFLIDSYGTIKKQIDTLLNLNSIAVQSDDKVLVCGKNDSRGYLYRLNKDLSLDETFNNKISFDNEVTDVVIDRDKLYVSGRFSLVNDTNINDIARLKMNGWIDNSFNPGLGTNDNIGALTIQKDGKILLGKAYINSFNEMYMRGMTRLNADGSVDQEFNPPYINGMTSKVTVKDTSIYFAAPYQMSSTYGNYLIKLNLNGSIDTSFHPVLLNEFSDDLCLDFENNNLIFNHSNNYGLSKCDAKGKVNSKFSPEISRQGVAKIGDCLNGKLVLAGDFIKVNKIETFGVTLIDKHGEVDKSFILKENLGAVIQLKILNDSNILISTGENFFKVNNKAEIKTDFNFKKFKTLLQVLKFIVLQNGKIMASDCNNVYRLNQDGTEDTSFDVGTGLSPVCTTYDFDMQGDKAIFGSIFDQFNGTNVNKMVRLNSDGSVDQTFNIGSGPSGDDIFAGVSLIKALDNNEIIVAGPFESFNGTVTPNRMVKLSSDGKIDSVFYENIKKNFFQVAIYNTKINQIGNKLYFYGFNSLEVLNMDGTYDETFYTPFSISKINELIPLKESSQKKSFLGTKTELFALGTFNKNGTNNPSFIIKLSIEENTSPTTIEENKNTNVDFQLYPVPVKNKLYIKTKGSLFNSKITIYNLNGIELYNSIIKHDNVEIDFSDYSAGIYFVKVITPSGEVRIKKIEKQ